MEYTNTIQLSTGDFICPNCIAKWYEELPKRKDGKLDKRNPQSKEFNAYIAYMDQLSIEAMQSNAPFKLMSKSEWDI